MADSIVAAKLRIDGVDQVLGALSKFKSELSSLGSSRAKVDVDASAATAKIAATETAMKRLTSASYNRIKVDADMQAAQGKIAALEAQVKKLSGEVVKLRAEVDTRDAEAKVGGLTSKLKDLIANGVGTGIGFSLGGVIAGGIKQATDAIIGFNSRLEQTKTAFTLALGSESAANDFIKQLQAFAQRTPFQFEDVTRLAQQLMGMGIAAKDVLPSLEAIGNAVAGVGGGTEVLNRVVLAFGQINAAGKANAQDLRQLAEAGIPAYQMLAKTLGTDVAGAMKAIENGTVDSATAINALVTGMNARFGGLMDAQSKTLLGRLSNLKDAAQVELAGIGKGLFDNIGGLLDKAAAGLQSDKFKSVASDIANDLNMAATAVGHIADALGTIPAPVVEGAAKILLLVAGFKALQAVGGGIVTGVEAMVGGIRSVIASLTGETAALAENTAAQRADAASREANAAASEGAGRARAAGVGATMAAGLSEIAGPLAFGVMAYLGVKQVVLDPIDKAITDGVAAEKTKWASTSIDITLAQAKVGNLSPDETRAALLKQQEQIQQAMAAVPKGKWHVSANNPSSWLEWLMGGGADDPSAGYSPEEQKIVDKYKADLERIQQELAKSTPEAMQQAMSAAKDAVATQKDRIVNELTQGRIDVETARQQMIYAAIQTLPTDDPALYDKGVADETRDADERLTKARQAITQRLIEQEGLQKRLAQLAQESRMTGVAMPLDPMAGLQGTDKNAVDQVKRIEDAYKAAQQDAQGWAKELQSAFGDANKAASAIDVGKGFVGVERALPALQAAQKTLSGIGADSSALDRLSGVGAAFANITDEIRTASVAFDGYMAVFDSTESKISFLDAFKQKVEAVAKAAQDTAPGERTADQNELLAKQSNILATIADMQARLRANEAGDILGAAKSLPDLVEADKRVRDLVATMGGAKALQLKIEVDAEDAIRQTNNISAVTTALTKEPEKVKFLIDDQGVRDDIDAMGGDIAKLTAHDWAVILNALVGDRSGLDAIETFNRVQGAKYSVTVDTVYTSTYASHPGGNVYANTNAFAPEHLEQQIQSQVEQATAQVKVTADTSPAVTDIDNVTKGPYAASVHVMATGIQQVEDNIDALTRPRTVTINVTTTDYGYPSGAPTGPPVPTYGTPSGFAGPRAAGGSVTGYAIVGDTRGGDMSAAELVAGTFTVYSHDHPLTQRAINGMGVRRYAGGSVPLPTVDATAGGGFVNPYGPQGLAGGAAQATAATKQLTTATDGLKKSLVDVRAEATDFASVLRGLDPRDVSETLRQYQTLGPIFEKQAQAALAAKYGGDTAAITDADKANATAEATQRTLTASTAWARVMGDIRGHAAQTEADIAQMAQTIGGPLGQNLAAQARSLETINQLTDENARLTERRTQLEQDHARVAADRAEADLKQRGMELAQSIQDAEDDHTRQMLRTAEDTSYVGVQRRFEDRQRQLQFSQQLQATDLQNSLVDVQTRQQRSVWNRTAQEQVVSESVRAAGTNAQAAQLAANLAAMHDRDLKQKDADTQAIDDLQQRIRLEQRQAAVDSYNLESERIAAQRAHEDKIAGYDDEDRRIAYERQQRDELARVAAYNLEVERFNEDRRYQAAIDGIDRTIAANQKLIDQENQRLQAAQAALAAWQQADGAAAAAADIWLNAVGSGGGSNPTGLGNTPTTVTADTFGAGGTFVGGKALGGTVGPGESALVGDAPGGGVTPYSEMVTNHGGLVTVTPLANRPAAGGATFNIPVTITANAGDDEALIAEALRRFEARLRDALRRERTAGRALARARGG